MRHLQLALQPLQLILFIILVLSELNRFLLQLLIKVPPPLGLCFGTGQDLLHKHAD